VKKRDLTTTTDMDCKKAVSKTALTSKQQQGERVFNYNHIIIQQISKWTIPDMAAVYI
jgi:hypothetical protein